jgi:hypothetical protein
LVHAGLRQMTARLISVLTVLDSAECRIRKACS